MKSSRKQLKLKKNQERKVFQIVKTANVMTFWKNFWNNKKWNKKNFYEKFYYVFINSSSSSFGLVYSYSSFINRNQSIFPRSFSIFILNFWKKKGWGVFFQKQCGFTYFDGCRQKQSGKQISPIFWLLVFVLFKNKQKWNNFLFLWKEKIDKCEFCVFSSLIQLLWSERIFFWIFSKKFFFERRKKFFKDRNFFEKTFLKTKKISKNLNFEIFKK